MNYAKELMTSSSFYTLNKALVSRYGFPTIGLLNVLIDADIMCSNKDGWFYQTTDSLERFTGMKRKAQSTCISELLGLNILFQLNQGMPKKRYFKINYEKLKVSFLALS